MDDIQVSIICNTYNHEKYIRYALNGFVMQKTNFKYEVLVHDDASTDKTAEIIKEYELKYPGLIKPIYQTVNQYSQNISITPSIQYPRAKGKYIALCEGDDYWTDPCKLQIQFDIMESHPNIDMCVHGINIVDANTDVIKGVIAPSDKDCLFNASDIIMGGGGFVGTSSYMYRKSMVEPMPDFLKNYSLDYFISICGSLRGGLFYIAKKMSNYRYMTDGGWTKSICHNPNKYIEHLQLLEHSLNLLNKDTDYKYNKEIQYKIHKEKFQVLELEKNYKAMLTPEYRDLYKKMSWKRKIKVRFPFLEKIRDVLKKFVS